MTENQRLAKRAKAKGKGGVSQPKAKAPTVSSQTESYSTITRAQEEKVITRHSDQVNHTLQTPYSGSSTGNVKPRVSGVRNIDLLQDAVGKELDGSVFQYSSTWAEGAFKSLATDKAVDEYLAETSHYNKASRKWSALHGATSEPQLHGPYGAIFSSIAQELGGASASGPVMRNAVIREKQRMDHLEAMPTSDFTMPDVVFEAAGPSFHLPPPPSKGGGKKKELGYTNISSFMEVKLSFNAPSARGNKLTNQVGAYGRQVLAQQPTRLYLRAVAVTADECIVYHFDRSGVHLTPPFNIHDNPRTFIRVVLAISSLKEDVLGFDPAFKWSIADDGTRTGTVTVTESSGVQLKYKLVKTEPESRRFTLRGRGTTCWRARLLSGEGVESTSDVIIKRSWQSDGRVDEHLLLEEVKGLKGIGQIVTYGKNGKQTREWRESTEKTSLPKDFRNRTLTCVILEGYGRSIIYFRNQTQLLEAFRDSLAGHWLMYEKASITHRDIFPHNLLLGVENAEEGNRGVVIDLDRAVKEERSKEKVCGDKLSGKFMYMSVSLLASLEDAKASPNAPLTHPKHDRLDDLESFYYVFNEIIHTRYGNGKGLIEGVDSRISNELQSFGENDPTKSADAKRAHFTKPIREFLIHNSWLSPSIMAYRDMRAAVQKLVNGKGCIPEVDSDTAIAELDDVIDGVDTKYRRILRSLDENIKALRRIEKADSAQTESGEEDSDSEDGEGDGTGGLLGEYPDDEAVRESGPLTRVAEEDEYCDMREILSRRIPTTGTPSTPRRNTAVFDSAVHSPSPLAQHKRRIAHLEEGIEGDSASTEKRARTSYHPVRDDSRDTGEDSTHCS